jgi:hypothetical protein
MDAPTSAAPAQRAKILRHSRALPGGIGSFILDTACQRVYESDGVRQLHMSPEAHEEIERKIGQSLARSRLTKFAT